MWIVSKETFNYLFSDHRSFQILVAIGVVSLNAAQISSDSYDGCFKALDLLLQDRNGSLYSDLSKSGDQEKLNILKHHFSEEKCAHHGICSRNSKTNSEAILKEKTRPYITGFLAAYDNLTVEAEKSKMHNEIDYGIYETIKNHLIEVQYSEMRADCVVDFMSVSRSIEEAYTSDLFFNPDRLAKVIQPSIDAYEREVLSINGRTPRRCTNAITSVLRDRYGTLYRDLSESADPEMLSILKKHFTENECISDAICSHNNKTSDEAELKKKLKPYIKGFIDAYTKLKTDGGQSQTHDKIDEAIYETIRSRVMEKYYYSDIKADCFVDFIKSTGSIDKAYASDLFFDSDKLDGIIQPLLTEYDTNVANRTPEQAENWYKRQWKSFQHGNILKVLFKAGFQQP